MTKTPNSTQAVEARGVAETQRWRYRCAVVVLACALGACASRQQQSGLNDALIRQGEPALTIGEPSALSLELFDDDAKPPPIEDLEVVPSPVYVAPAAGRLEDSDPVLTTALLEASVRPSPEAHRKVADLYLGHGIMDMAYDHLLAARELAPDDAATHDSMARLWRSWGLGELGLGDAYRATHNAPDSPEAHNTLGTLLHSVGHLDAARREYERSVELDPTATYALNNLCYLAYTEGAMSLATEYCEAALQIDPSLAEPNNNLALIYLSTGRSDLAWKSLQETGTIWTAMYNLGMAHMARGDSAAAAAAFSATSKAQPLWAAPRQRAKQARDQSTTGQRVR